MNWWKWILRFYFVSSFGVSTNALAAYANIIYKIQHRTDIAKLLNPHDIMALSMFLTDNNVTNTLCWTKVCSLNATFSIICAIVVVVVVIACSSSLFEFNIMHSQCRKITICRLLFQAIVAVVVAVVVVVVAAVVYFYSFSYAIVHNFLSLPPHYLRIL